MALIRVGSRGSRLALTQAELAGEALRSAAESPVEIALVPITTAGDKDRTKPFGEIGVARRVRQGARGSAARGADRRCGALREGHDLDGHRGTGRRRVPAARGPARRALRRWRAPTGDAHRHRVGPQARAAARARAGPADRADARQHRHASAQARRARPRRDRPRRLRARPARPLRRGRGIASTRTSCYRRRARVRSPSRCARERNSSPPRSTTGRRAVASRPSAHASPRSAAVVSLRSQRTTTASA